MTLPPQGLPTDQVLARLDDLAAGDVDWRGGRAFSLTYDAGPEVHELAAEVMARFLSTNALNPFAYPSLGRMQAEVVATVAGLLHGEPDAAGFMTSGGTESLLLTVKAARNRGRERGVRAPEMVLATTAHAAFTKGAEYFGVRSVRVPVGDDYKADPAAMAAAVTDDTVLVVASAPSYPQGVIDPVAEIAAIAAERDVNCHVDACMGGMMLPFLERLGHDIAEWDFRVPGVTSISADTHKFGFGPKGTGVLLYRSKRLRRLQYFAYPDWPGGLYASPGLSGSRSGGLIAATWAAMVNLGERGYLDIAERIFRTAAGIRAAVEAIPELEVIGDPTFLVALRSASEEVDVFHVNDHLTARGWRMNGLQLPPALHFCVTLPNTQPGIVEQFAADLRDGVQYAKRPPAGPPRSGALYGGGTPAGNAQVRATLEGALDAMYELAPQG